MYIRIAAIVCLTAAVVRAQGPLPIEDLRLPLDRYENGQIKTQLRATQAKVPPVGDIEAREIRAEFFDENGNVEAFITAADCTYSRTNAVAISKSDVRLERKGVVLTGKGFEWKAKNKEVRILGDVKLVLKRNLDIIRNKHAR